MESLYWSFVVAIVRTFALMKFMNVFFETRRTSTQTTVLAYAFYPLFFMAAELSRYLGVFMVFFGNVHMANFTYLFPVFFLIALNYESSKLKRVVAALYAYITLIATISIVANLFFSPFFFSARMHIHWALQDVIIQVGASLVFFFAAALLQKYFRFAKSKALDIKGFWPLATIWGVIYMAVERRYIFSMFTRFRFMWVPLLLVVGIFLSFYTFYKLLKTQEDKLKSTQHEMKVHLVALKDLAGDKEQTLEYINNLIDDTAENETENPTD